MNDAIKIDIERLNECTRTSERGEGYLMLSRGDGYRIGLVAQLDGDLKISYCMEVLVRVFDRDWEVNAACMEEALVITKLLTERGYILTTEDDGWIYAQRSVDTALVDSELKVLTALMDTRVPSFSYRRDANER
ncbi:MAG: hypothetical protein JXA22_00060 [Candidatus Thermoplasmatota archaeon]|nr:hypothetical protein [Candidatus Thermoplasmatota archaeon]